MAEERKSADELRLAEEEKLAEQRERDKEDFVALGEAEAVSDERIGNIEINIIF